ncbi:MAG: VapC toxin family PIN domain ribonuclease [Acidobacterium sp.]|nr:PIN domain nuclease [Acidobacteriota bacterium]PHY08451.1 MAG: VapC toxin family PIN domain ribonuclease [Acidobacterium sp.]
MAEHGKVLVDASVWIDFLRGDDDTVRALNLLIKSGRVVVCGQVLQEVLQGSRDDKAFTRLEGQMRLWHVEAEEPADFIEAARVFARLRWQGVTIPPTDCLMAAIAVRRKLLLYANDSDFDAIPGLRRYQP